MRVHLFPRATPVALAVLCLAGAGAPGASAAADARDVRVVERMVPAGDVQIFVREVGGGPAGPALVMINGGPGLPHGYMWLLERLASPRLRVVSYDQRGTGRSTAPPRDSFSLAAYARDLDAVRSALRVKRLHLLGHSWGGSIALAYTAAHPGRVRSLVLVGSDPPDLQALRAGLRRQEARIGELMQAGKIPDPLPPVVGDDCSALATAIVPVFFADPDFAPPRPLITECRQGVAEATNAAMTNRVFARVRAGLARYRGPALIVMGREDVGGVDSGVIPQVRALASAQVRVELIPGAGHMPWFESPRFMPIVRRFVMSHIST